MVDLCTTASLDVNEYLVKAKAVAAVATRWAFAFTRYIKYIQVGNAHTQTHDKNNTPSDHTKNHPG